MNIALKTRQSGDVTIVDIAGRIQLGDGTSALREILDKLVERNQLKILLNLSQVSYIDSSGVGEMVAGFRKLTGRGGQLKLLNLAERIADLLQFTKLYTVFEVFDDEATANRSFDEEPSIVVSTSM